MEFHPDSLALIGNSEHLGVKMKVVSNDEDYGFQELVQELNKHIFERLRYIMRNMGRELSCSTETVDVGSISFTRFKNTVTNDTMWPVFVIKDQLQKVVMYIRIYSPAIPHISITNINSLFVSGNYSIEEKMF